MNIGEPKHVREIEPQVPGRRCDLLAYASPRRVERRHRQCHVQCIAEFAHRTDGCCTAT